jgi:septum formation protein
VRITSACPLLLGSASPRRRELLALAAVPFLARAADADETAIAGEAPQRYVERVTLAKLSAVRGARIAGSFAGVLVADTTVVGPDGGILGKPADDADARATLARLAGATHAVLTCFALADLGTAAAAAHVETVTTRVTFRTLAPAEADAYVASREGRDKAGAYAVQGRAAAFVERIDGSYTNVIGLPLCEVVVALRRLAWWGGAA